MTKTTTKAAEGGHWYTQDGRMVVTVTGAKGQEVKPDLRHARKLDLAPGCTTIIKAAAAPGLQVWRERQVLMAALTLPRMDGESDPDYCDRIMDDAARQAREAAIAGTMIHADIEMGINAEHVNPWVCEVQEMLGGRFGLHEWRTEMPCVSPYGYATKSDLSLPADAFEGGVVVDIKTKEGAISDARLWDEHLMQLAATRAALGMFDAECGILFVRRDEPQSMFISATQEDLKRGWEMFCCLLRFWQAKNKYRPSWAKEVTL
jgi:hypothetical protein